MLISKNQTLSVDGQAVDLVIVPSYSTTEGSEQMKNIHKLMSVALGWAACDLSYRPPRMWSCSDLHDHLDRIQYSKYQKRKKK